METETSKELLTAMYIVSTSEDVHSFDWEFVLPVVEGLDKLDDEYLLAYSHYVNDEREGMPRNYLRFRLFGTSKAIECFKGIEAELLTGLGYSKNDDDFSFDGQAKAYGITVDEMMRVFELWDEATRLKMELIKLWLRGRGNSWMEGTHYALNTLGLSQIVQISLQPMNLAYPEEEHFRKRNFPQRSSNVKSPVEYLREKELPKTIDRVHQAVTQKFPINSDEFDAWYTNRPQVFQSLVELGQSTARRLRQDFEFSWRKDMSEDLFRLLESEDSAPEYWEDSPDGALTGVLIVLGGWVANQAAQKSRENPQDDARVLFDEYIRPLLIGSMDLGVQMAEGRSDV
ncbi:MAG: hypothetical protein ACXABY_04000 [Candidatus Thorarchaeota archaeon]